MTGESRGAVFSDDGARRYRLWRTWDRELPSLAFAMLNPSTADAKRNDPTVERCERRARSTGYGGLIVVNLMAHRATDPRELYHLEPRQRGGLDDPLNRAAFEWAMCEDARVVCGWGVHGDRLADVDQVKGMAISLNCPLYALKVTASGQPGHPLYVPYSQKPKWWGGARSEIKIVS